MRLIAHISDLHFGKEDKKIQESLLKHVQNLKPDLVVISGDLTQRAKKHQFVLAKKFIADIPFKTLVIPGNHDMPLYNMPKRFLKPLKEYKRHITDELNPFFADEEIAVFGLNTTRSLSGLLGKISKKQIAKLHKEFSGVDASLTKIVVTHHPFVNSNGKKVRIISRASKTMKAIEHSGADVILAGHLHIGFSGDVSSAYHLVGRSIIVAHAGTAFSTHHRREPNSFNLLHIHENTIDIEVHMWDEKIFTVTQKATYKKTTKSAEK